MGPAHFSTVKVGWPQIPPTKPLEFIAPFEKKCMIGLVRPPGTCANDIEEELQPPFVATPSLTPKEFGEFE